MAEKGELWPSDKWAITHSVQQIKQMIALGKFPWLLFSVSKQLHQKYMAKYDCLQKCSYIKSTSRNGFCFNHCWTNNNIYYCYIKLCLHPELKLQDMAGICLSLLKPDTKSMKMSNLYVQNVPKPLLVNVQYYTKNFASLGDFWKSILICGTF